MGKQILAYLAELSSLLLFLDFNEEEYAKNQPNRMLGAFQLRVVNNQMM